MSADRSDSCLAIFDHDGVLVDSFELHVDSWFELGRRANLHLSRAFLLETFGMTNPSIFRRLLGEGVTDEECARLGDLKEVCYREGARGRLELMPGVRALLDRLTGRGVRLAIGSSAPLPNLELTVRETGLDGRFASIASLEDISRGKPDPEVFLTAARKAGNIDPARCIVFEDAVVGILAAKAAGMLCVGVGTTRPLDELTSAGADAVVPNLCGFDLDPWVGRLRAG